MQWVTTEEFIRLLKGMGVMNHARLTQEEVGNNDSGDAIGSWLPDASRLPVFGRRRVRSRPGKPPKVATLPSYGVLS